MRWLVVGRGDDREDKRMLFLNESFHSRHVL
jgi:hypothetical protein